MNSPILLHIIARWLIGILALLSSPSLFAQPELKFSIPVSLFTIDQHSDGITTPVSDGLWIQATGRSPLYVNANLKTPKGKFQIRRIVLRFNNPKHSHAKLRLIELKEGRQSLFSAGTNRSSTKVSNQLTTTNTWSFDNETHIYVTSKTTIRLEIASGLPIDPGTGPIPDNYVTPPGEPFNLISVDVYVKNPSFTIAHAPSIKAIDKSLITQGALAGSKPVAVVSANLPNSNAIIYAITTNNRLLWYRHDGREDGSFQWAAGGTGLEVGNGWTFKTVFGAGGGVLYAISASGDLIWYRHDGRGEGTPVWARAEGRKVNSGFSNLQVIAAGGSILYALKANGDLLWYQHFGYSEGTDEWAAREGKLVATNWNFSRIFAGDNGILYGLTADGDLYRFRHDGRSDGSNEWTNKKGQKIASGWNYNVVFSGGGGVIYALTSDQKLLWFRDDGRDDDTINWASSSGKVVGVGWNAKTIFSGALLE